MKLISPVSQGVNEGRAEQNGVIDPVFSWTCGRFFVDVSSPKVVGIVNVTPDSFFDGGRLANSRRALSHCEALLREGADILDIGGESSRPGAPPLSTVEELARVMPVIRESVKFGVPISVDTYKAEVMQAALDVGADIINDIWSLRQSDSLEVIASHPNCGVCLMHMHGEPRTMQLSPLPTLPHQTTADQVLLFLQQRTDALIAKGVFRDRISWDVGIGFGKTVTQNFELLEGQTVFAKSGQPLWVGWSRKSSLGAVTGLPVDQRLIPSVAAALLAVDRGARIVRVHDVAETVQALKIWRAVRKPPSIVS